MAPHTAIPAASGCIPWGRLHLQILETRYIDMVKSCLREGDGFGVIMITEGDQFLRDLEQQLPAVSRFGTYSHDR